MRTAAPSPRANARFSGTELNRASGAASSARSGPANEFPPFPMIRRIGPTKESQVESRSEWQKGLRRVHSQIAQMIEPRLKTWIWVSALIRRAELGGAAAFVAH